MYTCRAQADFLPIALVLGLSPGVPVEVPVVIIAEDGVTSLRYFLYIMRSLPPINATSPSSSVNGIGSLLGGSSGGSGTQSTGVAAAPSSGGLHFVPNGPGTGGGDTGKDSNPADLASILPDAPLQPGVRRGAWLSKRSYPDVASMLHGFSCMQLKTETK